MKITKSDKEFDCYRAELSYAELQAFRARLAGEEVSVVADEVLKALDWYLERLPGPGETEEDAKQDISGGDEIKSGTGEDKPSDDTLPPSGEADLGDLVGGADGAASDDQFLADVAGVAPEKKEEKEDEQEELPEPS